MPFMVNFRSAEGKQGYHPADSLEEAVRFVEHLRNQEHVVNARVWRLQEVPLEVKTYYKVEVAPQGSEAADTPHPGTAQVGDDPSPEAVPVSAEAPPGATVRNGPATSAGVSSGPAAPGAPNGARFGRFNRI